MIKSESLQHRQANRPTVKEAGSLIDMGLGPATSVNHLKKQRKDMLKDINMDVNSFMKDFEEQKSLAKASS